MLKGKSWSVKGAGESGDRMGDNDEEDEAKEEPLGRPSVLSSVNRGSLASSSCERLMTSPYSSSSTSILASSKSTIPGGADTDSGINNLSPPVVFSSRTPNELTLLDLCTTRGGLKLRSRPNTRITPLRALADRDELLDDGSKRSARNDAPWICD